MPQMYPMASVPEEVAGVLGCGTLVDGEVAARFLNDKLKAAAKVLKVLKARPPEWSPADLHEAVAVVQTALQALSVAANQ